MENLNSWERADLEARYNAHKKEHKEDMMERLPPSEEVELVLYLAKWEVAELRKYNVTHHQQHTRFSETVWDIIRQIDKRPKEDVRDCNEVLVNLLERVKREKEDAENVAPPFRVYEESIWYDGKVAALDEVVEIISKKLKEIS